MQRNDFVTHKPIPRLQTSRDRVIDASIGCRYERRRCPFVLEPLGAIAIAAILFDLEPDGLIACRIVLAAFIPSVILRSSVRVGTNLHQDISPCTSISAPGGSPASPSIASSPLSQLGQEHARLRVWIRQRLPLSNHRIRDRPAKGLRPGRFR